MQTSFSSFDQSAGSQGESAQGGTSPAAPVLKENLRESEDTGPVVRRDLAKFRSVLSLKTTPRVPCVVRMKCFQAWKMRSNCALDRRHYERNQESFQ